MDVVGRLLAMPGMLGVLVAACVGSGDGTGGSPDGGAAADAGSRLDARRAGPTCWSTDLELPCCYARSNADRLDEPELLVVYFAPTEPAAFLSIGNVGPLVEMVQSRRLTWLLELSIGADGSATVRTGGGRLPATDRTLYEWFDEDATEVPGRWRPATLEGTFVDEILSTAPLSEPLVLPVFDQRTVLATEIEIHQLAFEEVRFSESRTCVGALGSLALTWSYDVGVVTGYLPIESNRTGVLPNLGLSLCEIMAGVPCDEPREAWTHLPDSLCEAGACEHGACDPGTTCNAYRLRAHIGGAGAEIAEEAAP